MSNDKSEATYHNPVDGFQTPEDLAARMAHIHKAQVAPTDHDNFEYPDFPDYDHDVEHVADPNAFLGRSCGVPRPHVDLSRGVGYRLWVRVLGVFSLMVVAAVAALYLTGVAKADPSINGVDLVDGEESYLVDIDYFAKDSETLPVDIKLLTMGYEACIDIHEQPTTEGVQAAIDGVFYKLISGDQLIDAYNSGVITGRAVEYLCPGKQYLIDDFLEEGQSVPA